MENRKVLAIDYGTKRIGLALSHASLADPLEVIEYTNLEEAIERIDYLCQKHGVTQLVLGISEQRMAEKTQQFRDQLHKKIDLPIEFVDETLSSHDVREKMRERGKRISGPIDHLAASLFLEDWLSYQ